MWSRVVIDRVIRSFYYLAIKSILAKWMGIRNIAQEMRTCVPEPGMKGRDN